MEGLNTRFDKYGSMVHKMHVFVPSVIGMRKVEGNYKIEEIIHEYRDDLSTPKNGFKKKLKMEKMMESCLKGKST